MTKLSAALRASLSVCAAATMLFAGPRFSVAGDMIHSLAIRVYDFTGLPPATRAFAVSQANAILNDAGLAPDWQDCSPRAVSTECNAPRRDDLIVRFVREIGDTPLEWRQALGYSVIEEGTHSGTLATIYLNRVEATARHARADERLLLGRTLAHEIGHLLLRTNSHSTTGLMRAIWTEDEMVRNRPEDWLFASGDRRQLRADWQQVAHSASK